MSTEARRKRSSELTDQELDSILTVADDELTAHVQTNSSTGTVFAKIMELRGMSAAHTAAGIMLRARVSVRDIEGRVGLEERSDDIPDAERRFFQSVGGELAASYELDRAIDVSIQWADVVMRDIGTV